MKKCKRCGSILSDNCRFCCYCGSTVPKYQSFGRIVLGFFQSIAFVLLYTVIQYVVSIAATVIISVVETAKGSVYSDPNQLTELILSYTGHISIICAVLAVGAVFLWFGLIRKKDLKEEIGLRFSLPGMIPVLILLGVALNYFVSIGMAFIPFPEEIIQNYNDTYKYLENADPVVNFITTAVCAPIVEELIFRAACFGKLRRIMPKAAADIISAAIFGLAHGNVFSFIFTSLIGAVLALIYDESDSVFAPMLVHFGFNAGSYLVTMMSEMPLLLLIAFAVSATVSAGCFALVIIKYRNKKAATPRQYFASFPGNYTMPF